MPEENLEPEKPLFQLLHELRDRVNSTRTTGMTLTDVEGVLEDMYRLGETKPSNNKWRLATKAEAEQTLDDIAWWHDVLQAHTKHL